MLPPEYFEHKEDRMIEIYRELEDFILKDIARRLILAGEMTATADRLIYKLRQMGESKAEIIKKLQVITRMSKREIKRLLQNAVISSFNDDAKTLSKMGISITPPLENEAVIAVMDAEYKKTRGELQNLTRTAIDQSQTDLINMLDEAEIRISAGAQSYSEAVNSILDRYAGRGIMVKYPTGARRTIEAAVRTCVVTSMNQTAAQITNQYIVEAKSNIVLVSAHLGARVKENGQPELAGHDSWQGMAYSIRGEEPGYPNLLESTGYDIDPVTGEGTVVNPLGLHGYNCRHSHKPWDKRLRNPYIDKDGKLKVNAEENRKRYELSQRQRAMERAIRKTRRMLVVKKEQMRVVSGDEEDKIRKEYERLNRHLQEKNKAYNDFCDTNGLAAQYERLKIAVGSEERKKTVDSEADSAIIGSDSRTVEQLTSVAETIRMELPAYTDRESKWSGKIEIDNSLAKNCALGMKRWNCNISLVDSADDGVVWHEMLHSCSVSYYDQNVYCANNRIEEASVEYLKQQICNEKGIKAVKAYEDLTGILQVLNNKFMFGADMEFARELFQIPLPDRYQWLEDKVDTALRMMDAQFEDYNDVMKYIENLKG